MSSVNPPGSISAIVGKNSSNTFFLKANKIRGTIFNHDIEPLQNTLELGKTYHVSNAIVADEKPSYKLYGTETHLTFRRDTKIDEVQEDNTAMVEDCTNSLYSICARISLIQQLH